MAGKRRDSGRPLRRESAVGRRRARLDAELAAATNPRDRVAIAADFVRTLLARYPDAGEAERVVEALVDAGTRIYRKGERAA